jgi:glycosyltransferase involved in cell wall biosynthesis
MKILLFGEFSGFYNCLRDGLVENGHDVFMVSNGDGKRNYPADYNWFVDGDKYGRLRPFMEVFRLLKNRNLLKGYDVVMLIHPHVITNVVSLVRPVYDYILKNNDKVFLSGAGLFNYSRKYWYNTNEKYHNYVVGEFEDLPKFREYTFDKKGLAWEDELFGRINGYIPIWYEYAQPFKDNPKCLKTIRIPINCDKHEYKPNIINNKIIFLASISPRKNAKGFHYIKTAFDIMKRKYGDVADFIAAGGLPFNEYMDLVARTNVILDDANSYSIAMNGLFSLAKGKIVMGGAEPVANKELGLDWNPVINLCPDVDQICSCIENVIEKKDQIEDMGRKGRDFVEQYHDYRDIAKQYIEVFEQY